MNFRKAGLILFCASVAFAQSDDSFSSTYSSYSSQLQDNTTSEKLNLFGGIGFGFRTGGELYSSTTTVNGQPTKKEDTYFNYGQGIKIDLGVQYFMMENVALQAGFGYSGRVPGLDVEQETSILTVNTKTSTHYSTNLFGLKVHVVPRFEVLELLNMYAGVGVGFFWNSMSYETTLAYENTTYNEEGKIRSGATLGLLGLLGADFPLSDLMSLYGELGFEQMSFKWKETEVKKTNIPEHAVGKYKYDNDAPNMTSPPRIPGSNWQIRAGVRFILM